MRYFTAIYILFCFTPAILLAQEPSLDEKARHYTIYYEALKNGRYDDALPHLKWILKHAPLFIDKNDDNYYRAVVIYGEKAAEQYKLADLYSEEGGKETAQAFLDSALVYYDMAIEHFKRENVPIDAGKWTEVRSWLSEMNRSFSAAPDSSKVNR